MSTIRSTQYKMTELGPLPEEWRVVRLGEVVSLRRGTVDPAKAGYRRYVGLEHIQPGNVRLTSWGDPGSVKSAKAVFKPGDILFAKLRPYLDKAAIAESEGICSTDILVLTPGEHIDNWYFAFLAHHPFVLNHAISTTTGVNHPRTSWRALSVGLIPLPPIPEQRAIAHVLRTVQRAKEATERVIAALKELKKSLMKHLFSYGPVPLDQADQVPLKETEIGPVPEHWEVVRLGEVANVKGGKRLPKGHKFSEKPTPYPYIRVVDFRNGTINKANLKFLTPEDYQLLKRYTISSKDVYISIAGTIGLVGVVPPDLDGANLTENAAKIVLNDKRLDQLFLVYALSSERGQEQIHQRAAKTSQPKLALTRIRQIPIPLPPLLEQREIVRILQTVDRKIEAEENRKRTLEALFKTLLHHLMTGRVRVTPGRTDREGG